MEIGIEIDRKMKCLDITVINDEGILEESVFDADNWKDIRKRLVEGIAHIDELLALKDIQID